MAAVQEMLATLCSRIFAKLAVLAEPVLGLMPGIVDLNVAMATHITDAMDLICRKLSDTSSLF